MAADLGGAQAGVEPPGVERGVGLTLAVDQRPDVVEKAGEVLGGPLAPPRREGIDAADAAVEFVGALADGDAAPTEFAFRPTLAAGPEQTNGSGHEEAAVEATQRRRRLPQIVLDLAGEFHEQAPKDEREAHPMG